MRAWRESNPQPSNLVPGRSSEPPALGARENNSALASLGTYQAFGLQQGHRAVSGPRGHGVLGGQLDDGGQLVPGFSSPLRIFSRRSVAIVSYGARTRGVGAGFGMTRRSSPPRGDRPARPMPRTSAAWSLHRSRARAERPRAKLRPPPGTQHVRRTQRPQCDASPAGCRCSTTSSTCSASTTARSCSCSSRSAAPYSRTSSWTRRRGGCRPASRPCRRRHGHQRAARPGRIVAKRQASTYRPGQRSPDWRKVKHQRMQEVVIAGWRPGEGRQWAVSAP